ncbi:MAG: TolC family protein, partial [Thermoanaerobaculia bacterium]
LKLEQNLLYPKKRKAMEEIAKGNKDVSETIYEIAKAEIRKRIREIYGEIYALNKEKEGIKKGIELLNSLKIALSGKISSGENQENFLKIEVNLYRYETKLKEIEDNIFILFEELKRITGYSLNFNDLKISNLMEYSFDERVKEKARENSPLLKYYSTLERLNEKELLKSKLDLKPNIIAFSGLGLRGGMEPVITLGTSIELPFWKKAKEIPLILAQEKKIEGLKEMMNEALLKIEEDINGAMEQVKNLDERIKLYNEGYLKSASLTIEAAISLYVSAKGDFSTVMENINLWIEGIVEVSKLEAEKFKAYSKILFHLEN